MIPLLIAIGVIQAGFFLFCVLSLNKIRRTFNQYEDFLYDLFQEGKNGEPSKAIQVADRVAGLFSARIIQTFEATLRGSAGGTMKGENALEVANNPFLGMMKGLKIGKSPLAAQVLGGLLQTIMGGIANRQGNNGHPPEQQGSMEIK